MLTYGLTGGIGCGKSTVAGMFREMGIPSFDTDELGHEILAAANPTSGEILARHPECAAGGGAIDRGMLAKIVFDADDERRWLEDLLHPAILKAFIERRESLARPRPPMCLLEGALLIESRSREFMKELAGLLVVTAPLAVRRQRLELRKPSSAESTSGRLAAQLPEHHKILAATHLIDNSGSHDDTRLQVEKMLSLMLHECGGSG